MFRKSELALPWVNKYERSKVKIKGREVWQYHFAEEVYPDELIKLSEGKSYQEGALKKVTVNSYERNPRARQECIQIYKAICSCCGFDFHSVYGDIGFGFIHVHHIKPVSEIDGEYEVSPREDLRPVCPNCHAMLHRKTPPYSINEVKEFIEKNRT